MKSNTAVEFAAEELKKYLELLKVNADIKLGFFEDFGLSSEVEDPFFDDAFKISVKDKKGFVAGSNGRSVLFGIYRLLEEWGIRWVRPGKNGTYMPKTTSAQNLDISEKADHRHRTMCIEGADTLDNILDMIDWMPKVGFNSYYIQFEDAYVFFDRWFSHTENPIKKPEPFSAETCKEYVEKMIWEIKKRGLLLHRMGHGWTCAPFGLPNQGWAELPETEIPKSYKDISAMINGERKVWKNMPAATQLCYSNPYVSGTIVDAVVRYAEGNPDTDVIHFWLGDYFRNTCECEECTKLHYSDYYVKMINSITEKLRAKGLKKKIAFEFGYDLCWTPKETEIERQSDLIMTFAPISRTFGASFPSEFKIKEMPPYEVNKCPLPRSVDENLTPLYCWNKIFRGDVADFDYHLMWDHVIDGGAEGLAKVVYEDIKNFKNLGINSFISCQLQRNSFPTALVMTVMGKTLWNTKVDFDKIRSGLYAASYGDEYVELFKDYFGALSKGLDIGAVRSQVKTDRAEFKRNLENAVEALVSFEKVLKEHPADTDSCRKEAWELLSHHREIYLLLVEGILLKLSGKEEKGNGLIKDSIRLAWEKEDEIQPFFDCYIYNMIQWRVNLEGETAFFDF